MSSVAQAKLTRADIEAGLRSQGIEDPEVVSAVWQTAIRSAERHASAPNVGGGAGSSGAFVFSTFSLAAVLVLVGLSLIMFFALDTFASILTATVMFGLYAALFYFIAQQFVKRHWPVWASGIVGLAGLACFGGSVATFLGWIAVEADVEPRPLYFLMALGGAVQVVASIFALTRFWLWSGIHIAICTGVVWTAVSVILLVFDDWTMTTMTLFGLAMGFLSGGIDLIGLRRAAAAFQGPPSGIAGSADVQLTNILASAPLSPGSRANKVARRDLAVYNGFWYALVADGLLLAPILDATSSSFFKYFLLPVVAFCFLFCGPLLARTSHSILGIFLMFWWVAVVLNQFFSNGLLLGTVLVAIGIGALVLATKLYASRELLSQRVVAVLPAPSAPYFPLFYQIPAATGSIGIMMPMQGGPHLGSHAA
jgi:hypothetical protein